MKLLMYNYDTSSYILSVYDINENATMLEIPLSSEGYYGSDLYLGQTTWLIITYYSITFFIFILLYFIT